MMNHYVADEIMQSAYEKNKNKHDWGTIQGVRVRYEGHSEYQ